MKKLLTFFATLLIGGISIIYGQAVGIGTSTPNSSSILELASTQKGFLPPRMTATQRDAITLKPEGLTIYNTTNNCLEFWNATRWVSTCAIQPNPVKLAYWATYSIGSAEHTNFNSQLNNTNYYGQNGTFKGVSNFELTNITSTLSTLTAQNLIDTYDMVSTGYSIMNATDAAKIKAFVDAGKVAIILLDSGPGANTDLHQIFGGAGTVGTGQINGTTNSNSINNGLFGDRCQKYCHCRSRLYGKGAYNQPPIRK